MTHIHMMRPTQRPTNIQSLRCTRTHTLRHTWWDRHKDQQTYRVWDAHAHTHTDTHDETDTKTNKHTESEMHTHTHRDTHDETDTKIERHRVWHACTYTQRYTWWDRHKDQHKDTKTQSLTRMHIHTKIHMMRPTQRPTQRYKDTVSDRHTHTKMFETKTQTLTMPDDLELHQQLLGRRTRQLGDKLPFSVGDLHLDVTCSKPANKPLCQQVRQFLAFIFSSRLLMSLLVIIHVCTCVCACVRVSVHEHACTCARARDRESYVMQIRSCT